MPPPARSSSNWGRAYWTLRPVQQLTTTSPNVTEELFITLRFVSEVADQGKSLIQSNCPTATPVEIDERYRKVRAFIRQAETFYRAARGTAYRSSALLYYYAFLNLAKAALEVRGLPYHSTHGLTARPNVIHPDLSLQEIEVPRNGVFPSFYTSLANTQLPPNVRLNLRDLLAYVTEIGFQYQRCGFGATAISPECFGRFLFHAPSNTGTGWVGIAVDKDYDFAMLPEPHCSTFDATYQQGEMPKDKARENFGIFAEAIKGFRFYEMRTPIAYRRAWMLASSFDACATRLKASLSRAWWRVPVSLR
jgi:hypothetical protein